ncbi:L,D-transpeptidase scaffold domain-containing protein [Hymenobacter psychrotolerans]|uniref:L,D-transpeptidase catalytic domain n=1 Tax=Hymenobacter psychrotolerans DSM 18569 TaxID=1121959 RepID=A0A1M7D6P2_9BACT|nr:L,D-transpeptidase family protein [Hymenobacter psychrotolerans]SHL75201.1 L,D-transpeptidase catalytic domain [Hymenobacter psychrotolerans DSM 18569]
MIRLRSCTRSAFLAAAIGCSTLFPAVSLAEAADTFAPAPATQPEALSVRSLLDTVALGPAATYAQLGLQAGAAVQTFYSQRNFAAAWTQPGSGWNAAARQALTLLRRAPEFGLDPGTYAWSDLLALPDSLGRATTMAGSLPGFELRLTDALLRYAIHLRHGRLQPGTLTRTILTAASTQQAAERLRAALGDSAFGPEFLRCQPSSQAYTQLQQAWSARLSQSTDSLQPNRGNAADFRRVSLNLERLRWEAAQSDTLEAEYALVNIPAYTLQIIKNGQVVQSHRVVVGKSQTPTPSLDSHINVFITAPDWRVPYSIAANEILPELQNDPSFLADNHYRLFDYRNRPVNPWRVRWSRITPETFPYTIRQTPGRHNALGSIVFYFANEHAIYVHDTPAKSLFRQPQRARSHGCIRLEKPLEFAAYLLKRENQQAALPDMRRSIARQEKCRYDLTQGLPIRVRYFTCEARNGRLYFYQDVYCQDEQLAAAVVAP